MINVLENKDCSLTFIVEDQFTNMVRIEFIVKNNTVVDNLVSEPIEKGIRDPYIYYNAPDGLFTYYIMWVYNEKPIKGIYLNNGKLINVTETGEEELTNIIKAFNINKEIDSKYSDSIKYFNLCHFKNCYINGLYNLLNEFLNNGCEISCRVNKDLENRSNLLILSLYVLNHLICSKDYDEAQRILDIITSCDGFLCSQEYYGNLSLGGCNCGK